ncbi:MAG: hypothetical protein K0B09_04520 [Bacteroidales bacterium]|nr:hypothetical protein [Bacteroidales bacterium]
MATRKLKNFEFAGLQNAEAGSVDALHTFNAFETPNGFVFLVSGSSQPVEEAQQVGSIINERIRYYLENEVLADPKEAVRNALVYANGFIFEKRRKEPEFTPGEASVLCLLVRDEKVYYAWMGDVSLYLYTGKRRFTLTWPLETAAEHDAESEQKQMLFLGAHQLAEPAVCDKALVPVDNDMLFMATGSGWQSLREKAFCGVLADSMPSHTKVQRLVKIVTEQEPDRPVAAQLIAFYNLAQNERSFVAGKSAPVKSVIEKIQSKIEDKPKSTLVKSLLIAIGIIILGYMFWDIFLNNPQRPVNVEISRTAVEEADSLALDTIEAAPERAAQATLPADVEYVVRSGDTWGSIYRQYEVCSWFIRNHPSNAGRFDADDNPVFNTTLVIPVKYSASSRLNPSYYREFTTDKVGNACQNVNETFKRRADQKLVSPH